MATRACFEPASYQRGSNLRAALRWFGRHPQTEGQSRGPAAVFSLTFAPETSRRRVVPRPGLVLSPPLRFTRRLACALVLLAGAMAAEETSDANPRQLRVGVLSAQVMQRCPGENALCVHHRRGSGTAFD
jgi:hypothetical protein